MDTTATTDPAAQPAFDAERRASELAVLDALRNDSCAPGSMRFARNKPKPRGA